VVTVAEVLELTQKAPSEHLRATLLLDYGFRMGILLFKNLFCTVALDTYEMSFVSGALVEYI
jgi:hypothetical protein